MQISDVVLMFNFNGERYRVKLSNNQVSKVPAPRKYDSGVSKVSLECLEKTIAEMGFDSGWVDCTLLNDKLGKVNSANLGKTLDALGFSEVFRIKVGRRNHYIRYSPFLIEREGVVAQIKNPVA